MDIDNKILIASIEARPMLWDKTLDCYEDSNLTRRAWNEVCIELYGEFEELEDGEKIAFGKEVLKRWTDLRDAFANCVKKLKVIKWCGFQIGKLKRSVYYKELQFLEKLYVEPETSSNSSEDDSCGATVKTEPVNLKVFEKPAAIRKHKNLEEEPKNSKELKESEKHVMP